MLEWDAGIDLLYMWGEKNSGEKNLSGSLRLEATLSGL